MEDDLIKELDDQIREVREQIDAISLPPKQSNLVKIILTKPTQTYKASCYEAGFTSVTVLEKDTPTRKVVDLYLKLGHLTQQRNALITREDVLLELKRIISQSAKDRVPAIALAAKILGLEAPIKTESTVQLKQINIQFLDENNKDQNNGDISDSKPTE